MMKEIFRVITVTNAWHQNEGIIAWFDEYQIGQSSQMRAESYRASMRKFWQKIIFYHLIELKCGTWQPTQPRINIAVRFNTAPDNTNIQQARFITGWGGRGGHLF